MEVICLALLPLGKDPNIPVLIKAMNKLYHQLLRFVGGVRLHLGWPGNDLTSKNLISYKRKTAPDYRTNIFI